MNKLLSTLVVSALVFCDTVAEEPIVVFAKIGETASSAFAVMGQSLIFASDGTIALNGQSGTTYSTNSSSLRSISFTEGDVTTTALSQLLTDDSELGVYPNPADDEIVVSGLVPGDHVSIYSASGRKAADFTAVGDAQNVNVSALPAGIYLITNYETTIKFEKK